MSAGFALACAGLCGAALLVIQNRSDGLRLAALVVSAIQVLLLSGWLNVHIRGLSLLFWTGAALAVLGAVLHFRAGQKSAVTAATAVLMVGAVQLLQSLHLLRPL